MILKNKSNKDIKLSWGNFVYSIEANSKKEFEDFIAKQIMKRHPSVVAVSPKSEEKNEQKEATL